MAILPSPPTEFAAVLCLVTVFYFKHVSSQLADHGIEFDFVIVGGGTSGCVVARRLAESGKHSVLLIEAGGFPYPDLSVPALSPQYTTDPNLVKLYPIVPQAIAALASNGVVNFTVSKVLGGGSSLNGLIFSRGSPHDYNNWANITKDDSWNYANLLKYFKKLENYTGEPSDQRGFNGPVTVSRQRYAPGSPEWLEAGIEMGYPTAEPNGPQIMSFTKLDYTKKFGRRVSSYTAYIEPLLLAPHNYGDPNDQTQRGRQNLVVLINTEVSRIVFDKENKKAVGVRLRPNLHGLTYVGAKKEVILTAGVVETPTLLMRSGIGPASVLDKHSTIIPVVKYLPVGTNLQDHVAVSITVIFGNASAAFDSDKDLNLEAWRTFIEQGDGPYTAFLGQSNHAFVASSILPPHEKNMSWADIQLVPQNSDHQHNLVGDWDPGSDIRAWEIAVRWQNNVARPKSRGTVTLDPDNVENAPRIDFQYFSHPDDLRVMLDGVKINLQICEETKAFQRIGCRVPASPLPACKHLEYRSEAYWTCYIRQLASFGLHSVGTCRMGSGPEDSGAVVDSKLRVIGIGNLRIADASIMPGIPNSNTQAAVYVISEKVADDILSEY